MSNSVITAEVATTELSPRELVMQRLGSEAWQKIEQLEHVMEAHPEQQVALPLRHIFTPHLYTREIYMFAGTLLTSRVHLYEHPFVVSRGTVLVWDDDSGWVKISAPFTGVTKAGTRRVLYTLTDVIWTTFHVTDRTDPDEVVREVTFSEGKFESLGCAASDALKAMLLEGDQS